MSQHNYTTDSQWPWLRSINVRLQQWGKKTYDKVIYESLWNDKWATFVMQSQKKNSNTTLAWLITKRWTNNTKWRSSTNNPHFDRMSLFGLYVWLIRTQLLLTFSIYSFFILNIFNRTAYIRFIIWCFFNIIYSPSIISKMYLIWKKATTDSLCLYKTSPLKHMHNDSSSSLKMYITISP